ncbi:MAG: hypothetical protein LBH40_03355 [Alphaproteobacteria bacterium]|nr:hypothetical protein [Alphaproteobacteria bacterium]
MNTFNKRITIRFNKKEYDDFINLAEKYKAKSRTGFIKQLLFQEIKPFLSIREKDLIGAYIIELNGIGRNLNQLLKYKAHNDAVLLIKDIKKIIENGKKIL